MLFPDFADIKELKTLKDVTVLLVCIILDNSTNVIDLVEHLCFHSSDFKSLGGYLVTEVENRVIRMLFVNIINFELLSYRRLFSV